MTRAESKQKDESAAAFEAFAKYRDMGVARSTAAVARALGKSKALMDRWSSAHHWVRRAHSHDLEVDRRKRLGDLRAIEQMRKRQTKTALLMQEIADIELAKMARAAKKSLRKRSELGDKTVLKMADAGSKLERLNRGEPGEIVQNNSGDGLDLSSLTDDELRTLRTLRSKVKARQLAEEEAKGAGDD
ncbi:MAG: hypothetical protein QGG14_02850 [Planctomycetota bacterium]|nr:hypothetical protein [Planctomycetota bacterium]